MKTIHEQIFGDSRQMTAIEDESIDMVLTSPPYPMIDMWDGIFSDQSVMVKKCLKQRDGAKAFEAMHEILDTVWKEAFRVLKPGGFACINIGDATRTINERFSLYPNHARIIEAARRTGFIILPCILWRKTTNAPNKFMGSGMLPAGAYVTLEHEYILIFRKNGNRVFSTSEQKNNRHESAVFWEERNQWFSDIWFDVTGVFQGMKQQKGRKRSGAFPFELAFRLISMYSVKGDRVLDPFSGTGTTMAAAMACGRNSIGYEIDRDLEERIAGIEPSIIEKACQKNHQRLLNHVNFIQERIKTRGIPRYENIHYGFPVITNQEKKLILNDPLTISRAGPLCFQVEYCSEPQEAFCRKWQSGEVPQMNISLNSRIKQGSLF